MADAPYARDSLLAALEASEKEVAEYFDALSEAELVTRPGSAWAPAEHLEHLVLAIAAVARGFRVPRWLLRLRFGSAQIPSRSFVELRETYRARLAAGGRASGRYLPLRERGRKLDDEPEVHRARLLDRWYDENARLRGALARWSERDLDRVRMPHPLLGLITARELVFFTIYHGPHHVAAARSRLPGSTPNP